MLCCLTCRQTRFDGLLPVPEHLELRQRHVGRYLNRIETVVPLVADVGHCVPNWIERGYSHGHGYLHFPMGRRILTTLYLYEAQLPVHGEILQVHGTGRSDSEPANRDG